MIKYNRKLKREGRRLRAQMTDSEHALSERLRRKGGNGLYLRFQVDNQNMGD